MFSSTTFNPQKSMICCYVNTTSKVQVCRITNIPNWYLERVVFPGQRLIFETPSLAGVLEIHTGTMISAILTEKISCNELHLTSTFPTYSHI